MNVSFPLQCLDVTAKLPGYNNIAKGTGETKGSRAFQRVSRFLSKIVGAKLREFFSSNMRSPDIRNPTSYNKMKNIFLNNFHLPSIAPFWYIFFVVY